MITMDMLIPGETILVYKYGNRRMVLGKCDMVIFVSFFDDFKKVSDCYYTIEEINDLFTIEKPDKWHDITPAEFKEWWGKEVWMWDGKFNTAKKGILSGFDPDSTPPYTVNGCWYFHASITKPEAE